MEKGRVTRWPLLVCAALTAAFLVQGWWFLRANSQTYDEAVHLTAGYSYLATHDFRLNAEHPPFLKELAALPVYAGLHPPFRPAAKLWEPEPEKWALSRDFLYHSAVPHDELLTLGRLPGLLLGGILVALIGWWSYRLWGPNAAILSTALAAFEPNLLSNAGLITTDLGSTLFIFLAMYLLWEYGNSRSPLLLAAAGVVTGLALASKFTGVLLFGMGGVLLAAHVLLRESPLIPTVKGGKPSPRAVRLKQAVVIAAVVAGLATVTVLAVYFFGAWRAWLDGFRWQMSKGGMGHRAFFLGHYSTTGWLAYFPVAFLIKTPLPTVLLIAASLLFFRAGTALRLREALFLLVPVGVVVALVLPAKINIGVRYLLPIYPFLFVAASRLATLRFAKPWLAPALLGVPVLLTALSSLSQAPHQVAYFNEIVRGPGYDTSDRCLADTNIDWGQDLKGLKEYADKERPGRLYLAYFGTALPEAYGIDYQELPDFGAVDWPAHPVQRVPPDQPRKVLAVSLTSLQGVYLGEPGPYAFFYHQRRPLTKIGHSIWVYDLTGDNEALAHLADAYRTAASQQREAAARLEAGGSHDRALVHEDIARQWDGLINEE